MGGAGLDARALRDCLSRDAVDIFREFIGEPNRTSSTRSTMRWGKRGSFCLELTGPKAGKWYSHQEGQGGDVLEFLALHLGGKAEAFQWARDRYQGRPAPIPPQMPQIMNSATNDAQAHDEALKKITRAKAILKESVPLEGTHGEAYLRDGRGISGAIPSCVRFHPALWFSPLRKKLPAIVCPMRSVKTDAITAAHITYLHPQEVRRIKQDADGTDGRRYLGRPSGLAGDGPSVIKLDRDDEVTIGLGIAEGLETGLAARNNYGFQPLWVTGDAGRISRFPALPGIEALTIFADNDVAGLSASEQCADALTKSGIEVSIIHPKSEGADIADLTKNEAAA